MDLITDTIDTCFLLMLYLTGMPVLDKLTCISITCNHISSYMYMYIMRLTELGDKNDHPQEASTSVITTGSLLAIILAG